MSFERRMASCLGCQAPCFYVHETWPDGPLAGHPRVVGGQLDTATQIRFRLDDGAVVDLDFCVSCAARVTPADFDAIWDAIAAYTAVTHAHHRRPAGETRRAIAAVRDRWILGRVVNRRFVPELGRCVVDRRAG
jgi:hypothetical protein